MQSDDTPALEIAEPTGEIRHLLICAGQAAAGLEPEVVRYVEIGATLEVGRTAATRSCPRLVTDDAHMSRVHASVRQLHSRLVVIKDLGSRNGTFLDGARLTEARPLRDGAIIFAGAHVFVYRRVRAEDLATLNTSFAQPFGPVPTVSPAMARIAARLRRLAAANVEILLCGETGVGKEILARALHQESKRSGPFVAINCAAIPEGLIESELFGFEQGAHSTASSRKPGLIEQAQGGTLFLDEVGEMSWSAQAKLLRFIQDRQYVSLGDTRPRQVDVRIVAASSRSIVGSGNDQGIRRDLAARLGPEPIVIPPLRARREDIGLFAHHFLRDRRCSFEIDAYRGLFLNPWLGNVRELETVLRTASVLLGGDGSIGVDHLRWNTLPDSQRAEENVANPSRAFVRRPTPLELRGLLARHQGNVAHVAREIGRQRTLVWRWLRIAGLKPADYREAGDDASTG